MWGGLGGGVGVCDGVGAQTKCDNFDWLVSD